MENEHNVLTCYVESLKTQFRRDEDDVYSLVGTRCLNKVSKILVLVVIQLFCSQNTVEP